MTPVIRDMLANGELVAHPNRHAELLGLPGTSATAARARQAELTATLAIFHRYSSGSAEGEGVIGKAGEDMLERAFEGSKTMDIFNWGGEASRQYRGVTLEQPSDGMVIASSTVTGRSPIEHIALVEVKNRRDWVTADDYKPWKLIRNAYAFDIVGIYFARRIMRTAFWLTFKRIGVVGVETFNQFAPPDSETDLAFARHKNGLGYHDLYFKTEVPKHLQKQVDALPERLIAARDRMNAVRPIVENYVDRLADKSISGANRKALFKQLKNEIIEFDRSVLLEESVEGDDAAYDRYSDDRLEEMRDRLRESGEYYD